MTISAPGAAVAFLLIGLLQDSPKSKDEGAIPGNTSRIRWIRPFNEALKQGKEARRLVFVKPIIGGSNTPKPGGRIADGKNDCDGSW